MRKTLIIMTMGLLLTQTVAAQVHDEEKYLQWRSMETGPLGFEPKFYYWLFHNNYAHHEWEWEWHGFESGFYLHLKPNKSDAKPVVPKRSLLFRSVLSVLLLTCGRRNRRTHRKRTSSISWNKRRWQRQTAEWMLPICSLRMTLTICRTRFPQD